MLSTEAKAVALLGLALSSTCGAAALLLFATSALLPLPRDLAVFLTLVLVVAFGFAFLTAHFFYLFWHPFDANASVSFPVTLFDPVALIAALCHFAHQESVTFLAPEVSSSLLDSSTA
jgi:hypothetical protein